VRVSVSLVTYNGRPWLDLCLASILAQTHPDLEIVALDNGSTDGTAGSLADFAARHPGFRLLLEPANLGFAGGHNRVIAQASGALVCLLNQDVVLDPSFISEAVAGFTGSPTVGAVQGCVYRMTPEGHRSEVLDTTGLKMHRNRRVVSRGQGRGVSELLDQPGEVFGADGPCPVYRRSALEDVACPGRLGREYLDEDFFAYKEDVDLAWRLRLAGWDAVYVPSAIAWHGRSAAEPSQGGLRRYIRHRRAMAPWLRRTSWRNHRLMLVKNESPGLFFRDFIPIAWREVRSAAFMAVVHPADLVAIAGFVRLIPSMLRKRRHLRRRRRVGDARFAAWLR
jgi:GT2 family glycosyltransferase